MSIKKDSSEDLIFSNRNGSTLTVYNDDSNTHNIAVGVDNTYNNYNGNKTTYEYGVNNKKDGATQEDGVGAKATHESVTVYT